MRELVLLAQPRDQLRQAFAVRRHKEGATLISLPVTLHQLRKILFEKRKKNRRRARFKKQGIGKNVIGSRFGSGADESFEIVWRVCDSGDHWRTADPDTNSRLRQLAYGLDAKIRPRSTRLQDSRQLRVESGDGNVNRDLIGPGDIFEKFYIAHDQVRFRDDP